ncbi:hypothetical protein NDU88_008135 [Pleurodeles waltl]|uniref:Uncharacterized protein n=1 Tax=Pleurodeles waltl TaxID=8319 RepID=A0AAV7QMM7_PLEWA|nr:hypothetical protein NDU88_008135 [Pleurodeles waltl]
MSAFSGWPHWEQGRTCFSRFERGAPSGGAPAGPTVPPQRRWVPPPKSGARTIPLSLSGSSTRARCGFDGEEGPQAFTQSGRPRSGCNVHRTRRGGYFVVPDRSEAWTTRENNPGFTKVCRKPQHFLASAIRSRDPAKVSLARKGCKESIVHAKRNWDTVIGWAGMTSVNLMAFDNQLQLGLVAVQRT